MSRNDAIEREIREFVLGIDTAEIDEETLAEFLLQLPKATGEVPIGIYYTSEGIGIIKVKYSGNPFDGVRKWSWLIKVPQSGSNYA